MLCWWRESLVGMQVLGGLANLTGRVALAGPTTPLPHNERPIGGQLSNGSRRIQPAISRPPTDGTGQAAGTAGDGEWIKWGLITRSHATTSGGPTWHRSGWLQADEGLADGSCKLGSTVYRLNEL